MDRFSCLSLYGFSFRIALSVRDVEYIVEVLSWDALITRQAIRLIVYLFAVCFFICNGILVMHQKNKASAIRRIGRSFICGEGERP